ncbi:unnamed protein product [Colias eurytheme]|nr:unnamed protein product [Colias eurytheme]
MEEGQVELAAISVSSRIPEFWTAMPRLLSTSYQKFVGVQDDIRYQDVGKHLIDKADTPYRCRLCSTKTNNVWHEGLLYKISRLTTTVQYPHPLFESLPHPPSHYLENLWADTLRVWAYFTRHEERKTLAPTISHLATTTATLSDTHHHLGEKSPARIWAYSSTTGAQYQRPRHLL